jgi:hypothetical protein
MFIFTRFSILLGYSAALFIAGWLTAVHGVCQ